MLTKFLDWLGSKEAVEWFVDLMASIGGKLLIALLILVVGLYIIKRIKRFIKSSHRLDKLDISLRSFLSSFASIALYIVLFITLAMVLGIPVTSFITVLATCGAAIGLALQGALSNFAGGLMILLFKPFKVGDYIEAAGEAGTVSEITVVYTVLLTPDNKQITIPNGSITNAVIENYSAKDTRRVDWLFTADYSCDSDKVKAVIENAVKSHKKALSDPAPFVRVSKCADSGVEYTARVWVNSADYWDVYFDVLDGVKKAFAENDIIVPYPQMDVHVKQ
ncbi:MAG: mechanosensitive ion channel family protein [Clostridia bacterium]|nr:mechanosensitive ion channel family protein [Clostridia bacterium]